MKYLPICIAALQQLDPPLSGDQLAAFANHRLPPALARWEAGKVRRALKRAAQEAVLCGSKPQICVGTTTLRRLVFWLPEQAAQVRRWVVTRQARPRCVVSRA